MQSLVVHFFRRKYKDIFKHSCKKCGKIVNLHYIFLQNVIFLMILLLFTAHLFIFAPKRISTITLQI